jgi:drug/metabolite transporter (DMT)-like permease
LPPTRQREAGIAIAVMIAAPLFFSSNMIFGRSAVAEVAPFTLAFVRWSAVALLMSPLLIAGLPAIRRVLRQSVGLLLLLAFLGMWVCGGLVYLGLRHTTATNGTLIYTTSPVIIILLEALFRGRAIGWREAAGSLLAFAGVAVIVLEGSLSALLSLGLNPGDLLFVMAATAWAVYSMLYRSPALADVPNLSLFALLAAIGAVLLAPVALFEWWIGMPAPTTASAWTDIAGIVFFASILAFSSFQFGIRRLGAPVAGIFMYLLPVYGVGLAVTLLGERLMGHHLVGIAMVMGGVILATLTLPGSGRQPSNPSDGKVSSSQ